MNIQNPAKSFSAKIGRPARKGTRVEAGRPYPRGAHWDGLGVNFALFSAHATKVELCLFDDAGGDQRERQPLQIPALDFDIGLAGLADPGGVRVCRG